MERIEFWFLLLALLFSLWRYERLRRQALQRNWCAGQILHIALVDLRLQYAKSHEPPTVLALLPEGQEVLHCYLTYSDADCRQRRQRPPAADYLSLRIVPGDGIEFSRPAASPAFQK